MDDATLDFHASELITVLQQADLTVSVAESLTGGMLSMTIAQAAGSADRFLGGLVAYHRLTKHRLLGTDLDAVVTPEAAATMAQGTRTLLATDLAVAVTGVAGPDEQEGTPVGTVFGGWAVEGRAGAERWHFEGDPEAICRQTVDAALQMAFRTATLLAERQTMAV